MRFLLCAALLAVAGCISSVVADGALPAGLAHDGDAATGRSRTLLQAGSWKAACPVDLAAANFTELTSRCVWPPFDPARCCAAFKELACPYVDYLNDNSTDCAATMFQYIRLYGNYPPGVFRQNCKEGPKGLKC